MADVIQLWGACAYEVSGITVRMVADGTFCGHLECGYDYCGRYHVRDLSVLFREFPQLVLPSAPEWED